MKECIHECEEDPIYRYEYNNSCYNANISKILEETTNQEMNVETNILNQSYIDITYRTNKYELSNTFFNEIYISETIIEDNKEIEKVITRILAQSYIILKIELN